MRCRRKWAAVGDEAELEDFVPGGTGDSDGGHGVVSSHGVMRGVYDGWRERGEVLAANNGER